jgi:ATP-dependent Clp protease ATP-binding subunit ClpA
MFERFTQEARQSVRLAQDEARALGHDSVGAEHLLIGMAATPGPAAQVLQAHGLTADGLRRRLVVLTDDDHLDPDALAALGIDLERVKQTTEAQLGPGALDPKPRRPPRTGHLPMTKQGKKVLELALREAVALGSKEIGSGHLLLGLLRDGRGTSAQLLREHHLDFVELRVEVCRLIESRAA